MREENNITVAESRLRGPERGHPELGEESLFSEAAPWLLTYWRVLKKRRRTIFSILLVVFTLAAIATVKEQPTYRARAMVEIEKENPNILTVQELFQLENVSDTYLESQYKILQTESLAKRVIQQLRLDEVKEFNPSAGGWWHRDENGRTDKGEPETIADSDRQQAILHRFASRLKVEPVRQSRLVEVSFESHDREIAAKILNSLTSNYIDENLEKRWDATQKATEWISQQLQGVKVRLEKSEDDLQQYAKANGLLFLESGSGKSENIMDERLRQLQEELTRAQAERYEKESLYRLVQGGDYSSLPAVTSDKLTQELAARLAELQTNYAQLATTFSPDYPKLKQVKGQIDEAQKIFDRECKRAADRLTNEYTAAVHREELVERAFSEQQKRANEVTARAVQYNILKREVETNKQLYEGLLQRMKEAGVSAGLKASNIRIVDAAVPPTSPVKPRETLNLALALVLGLMGGIATALVQEHVDNTLKTSEDVEHFVQLPALATIPALESLNGHGRVYGWPRFAKAQESSDNGSTAANSAAKFRIDETRQQHSAIAEAFRGLRTSVLLSTANRPPRSLLVTSAQPAEGKTTVATNMAISWAQLGHSVLLIDADLRRPTIHKVFRIPSAQGLVNYLAGLHDWAECVVSAPVAESVSGLDLIPCGPIPPNPVELLSGGRMRQLLREAAKKYSIVLIDSPPLLNVADSRVLAAEVEGVLLIVRGNVTPHDLVRRARASVQNAGANILGVVLNSVDVRSADYHYYYYRQGYGEYREELNNVEGKA